MLIIEDIEVLSELTEVETFSSRNFDDVETQSNKTYVTSDDFHFDDCCKDDLLILLRIPQRLPLNQILPQLETFCENIGSDSSSNEPLSSPDSRMGRKVMNGRKISPIKEVTEGSRTSSGGISDARVKSSRKDFIRPPTRRQCWEDSTEKNYLQNNSLFEVTEVKNFKTYNPFVLLENYGVLITSKDRNKSFKISSEKLLVIQVDTDSVIDDTATNSVWKLLKFLACCFSQSKRTMKAKVCKTFFVKCKRKEEESQRSWRGRRCNSAHI